LATLSFAFFVVELVLTVTHRSQLVPTNHFDLTTLAGQKGFADQVRTVGSGDVLNVILSLGLAVSYLLLLLMLVVGGRRLIPPSIVKQHAPFTSDSDDD